MGAAGTMLLSEVPLGVEGGSQGESAPLPSSEVQLTDGSTVSITGNVSASFLHSMFMNMCIPC